ncbi:hypothetical protein Back11_41920 [Paenibacillus baekrokdamisoli]|uniref:Uncharacterized protein n=2 Tax=Paenibacillus baekrokdamisoli TaxID=1712516 RepID=A0A3G9IVH7_9BACL|nr:hypothetical protein Back11_41920 [Paenibacillus baekrokdamisoli]
MFKFINLLVRFLLELVMIFALGYWGFHIGHGVVVKIIAGIGFPLVSAVIWGRFIAPKAPIKLPEIGVIALESILFLSAFIGLYTTGLKAFAIVFILIAIANLSVITKYRLSSEKTSYKRKCKK